MLFRVAQGPACNCAAPVALHCSAGMRVTKVNLDPGMEPSTKVPSNSQTITEALMQWYGSQAMAFVTKLNAALDITRQRGIKQAMRDTYFPMSIIC